MRRNTSLRYPGGRKTVWGVVAYVASYLLAYGLSGAWLGTALAATTVTTRDGPQSVAALLGETAVPTWTGAGWLFYNAHLVSIAVSRPLQRPALENLLTSTGGSALGLLVVPPLLLVLAGVMATRTADTASALRFDLVTRPSLRYGLNGGLVITFGYLPLALTGVIIFSVSAGVRIAPDLLLGWVLAGMVYPVVFGGIGGVLVHRWRRHDAGAEGD